MSYTVIHGSGSQARIYEDLTRAEAIEKAERMLTDGRRTVRIIGPRGETDLPSLKLEQAGLKID
ncbi:MAG: hypothetical protein FJX54_00360 [Alphaproteobacteria bacterium]|nr:hypothetical protein [Alphaproteobacteria bacterium]